MEPTTMKQILIEEMQKYAGEGLNATSYFTANDAEALYSVIDMAEVRGQRIVGTVLVARLYEDKIVIELDHNNKPLVDALTARNIPQEQIVLAYQNRSISA